MPGCSGDEVPYRSREYEKRLSDVFPTDEGRGCVCPLHSSGEERRYKLNDFNEADACDSGALHGFLHGVRPAGRGVARTCGGGLVARLAATDRILYRRCEKTPDRRGHPGGSGTVPAGPGARFRVCSGLVPPLFGDSRRRSAGYGVGTACLPAGLAQQVVRAALRAKAACRGRTRQGASAVRAAFGARPDQSRQHSYSGDPVPAGRDALFGDRYARFGRDAFR